MNTTEKTKTEKKGFFILFLVKSDIRMTDYPSLQLTTKKSGPNQLIVRYPPRCLSYTHLRSVLSYPTHPLPFLFLIKTNKKRPTKTEILKLKLNPIIHKLKLKRFQEPQEEEEKEKEKAKHVKCSHLEQRRG